MIFYLVGYYQYLYFLLFGCLLQKECKNLWVEDLEGFLELVHQKDDKFRKPNVKFEDMAGNKEAKEEVQEIDFLKSPIDT